MWNAESGGELIDGDEALPEDALEVFALGGWDAGTGRSGAPATVGFLGDDPSVDGGGRNGSVGAEGVAGGAGGGAAGGLGAGPGDDGFEGGMTRGKGGVAAPVLGGDTEPGFKVSGRGEFEERSEGAEVSGKAGEVIEAAQEGETGVPTGHGAKGGVSMTGEEGQRGLIGDGLAQAEGRQAGKGGRGGGFGKPVAVGDEQGIVALGEEPGARGVGGEAQKAGTFGRAGKAGAGVIGLELIAAGDGAVAFLAAKVTSGEKAVEFPGEGILPVVEGKVCGALDIAGVGVEGAPEFQPEGAGEEGGSRAG